jgi:hypothetical protein
MKRRLWVLIVALHLFLVSLLPLSHCHAIEESSPGGFYCVNLCDHADEHLSAGGQRTSLQTHHAHDHRHLHFLAEYFHYASDRKRLLASPAEPVTMFAARSLLREHCLQESAADILRPPIAAGLAAPVAKRVSGNSPPDRAGTV